MLTRPDRNGELFTGTREELRRHNDKLRKRAERANKKPAINFECGPGTMDALHRVMQRAGFKNLADFLTFQIHLIDGLDSPEFERWAVRTVRLEGLEKYYPLVNRRATCTTCGDTGKDCGGEPCPDCKEGLIDD